MSEKKHACFGGAIILIMIILTLLFPVKVADYCRDALEICARRLIPSVFIFTVLSKLICALASHGLFSGKICAYLSKILRLPETLIPSFILGLFCPAPSGAAAIADLYEKGLCSKNEAERASAAANNCSAAFIMAIGTSLTGSVFCAATILASEIISVLAIYMLFFRQSGQPISVSGKHSSKFSFAYAITDSISSSAEISVKICAYVLFFSTIGRAVCDLVTTVFQSTVSSAYIQAGILSFFEITTGLSVMSAPFENKALLLICAAVSFCGLSMLCQVSGILHEKGLSARNYIFLRFTAALLTPLTFLLMLFLIPDGRILPVFSNIKSQGGFKAGDALSIFVVTLLFLCGAIFMAFLDKKHKK